MHTHVTVSLSLTHTHTVMDKEDMLIVFEDHIRQLEKVN